MTYKNRTPLYKYWNDAYIHAARIAYPTVTRRHDLAVGWKLTGKDGTTHGGYYWPLINADHDLPVLHKADDWNPHNKGGCPSHPGDGFCLVPQGQPVEVASSGGVPLMEGVGHVLVYPVDLVRGGAVQKRSTWVIDVDCFDLGAYIRSGGVNDWLRAADLDYANLSNASLNRADLRGADLNRADLRGADLNGADLRNADLSNADLSGTDLNYANLSGARGGKTATWPSRFNWAKAGVLA